jgi:hypothetical protein
MGDLGVVIVGGPPGQFAQFLASERKKWSDVIQKRGIKAD